MANVPTRRVEVQRLPLGAELLELSSKAASRVRNGRTEVVIDQVVAPGAGLPLSFRYRLKSGIAEAPTAPADEYVQRQLKAAEAGDFWAKYDLWDSYYRG